MLEREIRVWKTRYPDARVYPIANHADVTQFLRKHDEHVLLAVIGGRDAGDLAQIVGHGHSLFPHVATSALVVPTPPE